jgi:ribosomal protein S27AE
MRGKAPIKIYPCPKCSGTTLLILDGYKVVCTACGTEGFISKWNALYRSYCGGPKYTRGPIASYG